jgi:hypothetical protein
MRCEPGCQCRRHQSPGRPRGSGVIPVEVRFWSNVYRRGYDECWPWGGSAHPYGRFGVRQGELGQEKDTVLLAHRVAFYLVHGRWPEPQGLHGCDNPPCCNAENSAHVHEGTNADNVREMWERGRAVAPPVFFGIEAHRAKLTDEQALEIIARYESGAVSQAALAVEYGVAQPSVSAIVRGRRRSLSRPDYFPVESQEDQE